MYKEDFPILLNNPGLLYLDNAATTQKPKVVIDAISNYYENYNANVSRGLYDLSDKANEMFDGIRHKVRDYINAKRFDEIVFTKNTTESLNLVANILGSKLKPGDEICLTKMEHHSNIVPWQLIAEKTGALIKYININDQFRLDLEDFEKSISDKTKIVSFTYISNVLGTINDVRKIIEIAKSVDAYTIIDGAQAAGHLKIDVKSLGCDFLAFSGHKMLGPMGIGVLYGRKELLEELPPFLGGGGMINKVELRSFKENILPYKYEAGTPNLEGIVGLGAAIDYINNIGFDKLNEIDLEHSKLILDAIKKNDKLKLIGPDSIDKRISIFSFIHKDMHPHDASEYFNDHKIAIRAGHCCCQVLMNELNINAVSRISSYFYNNDLSRSIEIIKKI